MAYFPMFVDLGGKRCLIIGGGRVAFRKASALISFGAQLLVIADHALPEMLELAESNPAVRLLLRPAQAEDAEGMDFVICASDDCRLNRQVSAYCRERQIPVNVADSREQSTFLFPGLVRQEDVVIGITTGGNSPAASRYLRQQMEALLPDYLGTLVRELGSCRELVKERIPDGKRREKLFSRLFAIGIEREGDLTEELIRQLIAEEEANEIRSIKEQGKIREHRIQEHRIQEHRIQERIMQEHMVQEHIMQEHMVQEHIMQEHMVQEHVIQEHIMQEHIMQEHTMKKKIRIGTRKSDLSVAQTMLVADAMKAAFPDIEFELVCRSTVGDKILDKPLLEFGGKGVFVSEFEEALLRGEIDFAVHSAKDLPMELAHGLEIAGALPRGDVRDVLVTMNWENMEKKRRASTGKDPVRIGTSSLRRAIQIQELGGRLWPERGVICENLRGNVLTRLDKLEQGLYDGIILAAAGLERLAVSQLRPGRYQYHYFSPEEMIPAGGQGILVIEGRKGDDVCRIARAVSDQAAMEQLSAERLVLKKLGSGCHEPVGVYCCRKDGCLHMTGLYERDGVRRRAEVCQGDEESGVSAWERAADRLADCLLGLNQTDEGESGTESTEKKDQEKGSGL